MNHSSLLLLPNPPKEVSFNSLKVAYGPSLAQSLTQSSQISSANTESQENDVSLTIAIAYSTSSFAGLQTFFGLMYRLACVISIEKSIDVQFGNDVDVRVILIECSNCGQQNQNQSKKGTDFISLADLAENHGSWDRIYSVESEIGEGLLRDFLTLRNSSRLDSGPECAIVRVPGGLTIRTESDDGLDIAHEQVTSDWRCHQSAAVGGTFDHLHAGHKLLLTMTALVLEPINRSDASQERCLTIGITGDDLLQKKKYVEELQTWEERQRSVRKFLLVFLSCLAPQNVLMTSKIVAAPRERGREIHDTLKSGLRILYKEIFDPFGPTITDSKITALVVSSETRAGGQAVNDKRIAKGWQPLDVFEVEVVDADEDGSDQSKDGFESKISSTEIRARVLRRKESVNARG